MLTQIIRIIIFNFFWVLWPLTFFFKRDKTIWLFGSYKNTYSDNSKYLFEYANRELQDVRAVWISGDKTIVQKITKQGREAYWRYDLKGIYLSLKASVFVFNSFISDVIMWTSRNALKINLWHGIPLKKIEHDIDRGVLQKIYQPKGIWQNIYARLYAPYVYDKSMHILATSTEVQNLFSKAFKVPKKQVFIAGYPRLKPLWDEKLKKPQHWCAYKQVLIYMPTFRDNSSNFLKTAFPNPKKLNNICKSQDLLLAFKLHPNTAQQELEPFKELSNIEILNNNQDVYPLLKFTTALITDYSSIYVDYAVLNKPILFYAPDITEYEQNSRGTYFDYDEITFNKKIESYLEFENALKNIDAYGVAGEQVSKRFWAGNIKNGSKEVSDIINSKLLKKSF